MLNLPPPLNIIYVFLTEKTVQHIKKILIFAPKFDVSSAYKCECVIRDGKIAKQKKLENL
jgi:hypothetical protein